MVLDLSRPINPVGTELKIALACSHFCGTQPGSKVLTREAGLEAGKGIAEDCKADPNALLFAIVDKHVRCVAEGAESAPK